MGITSPAEPGRPRHNHRSQRVLERLGFVEYGRASSYMYIAGEWQDNVLYQLITPTPEAVVAE